MDKKNSVGSRLVEAFGTNDKEFIAKILGFTSKQGVYKIIDGSRELDFEKLQKFRDYTKCSIDWLLTGEGPQFVTDLSDGIALPADLMNVLRVLAEEQADHVFGDLDIAGGNRDRVTLTLLAEYLLNLTLGNLNVIRADGDLMSRADYKRAQKFTFVADREPSIEERFRGIVQEELARLHAGDDEEDVTIEPADMMLAPVVAHISGPDERQETGDREKIRKTG